MNICIGPVCLPVWHILALVAFLVGPVWNFLNGRRSLTESTTSKLSLKYAGPGGRELKLKQTDEGKVAPLQQTSSLSGLSAHLTNFQRDYSFLAPGQERYVLIKFGAEWCGPCKRIMPLIETLRFCYQCAMFEVDVDKAESGLASGVSGLPTLRLYKWRSGCQFSGLEKIEETMGANATNIENMIARHCKPFV